MSRAQTVHKAYLFRIRFLTHLERKEKNMLIKSHWNKIDIAGNGASDAIVTGYQQLDVFSQKKKQSHLLL